MAAAPQCPSVLLLPHTPTRDRTPRPRCTLPRETPPCDAFLDTPCGTRYPHTSRRALCKNQSRVILRPSSRFLRVAGWSAPSFLQLSGISRATDRDHSGRRILRTPAAQDRLRPATCSRP